ncbi:Hypothetical predicted protein [Cloeon dipterum]|uniref:Uncharacterized protein n=1 Tax=Cloeon dipterum TaxID=197152 RepID=A0A8S1D050_9INSE|nr:Hypothetical predicted protein [Cloeon dipterum]
MDREDHQVPGASPSGRKDRRGGRGRGGASRAELVRRGCCSRLAPGLREPNASKNAPATAPWSTARQTIKKQEGDAGFVGTVVRRHQ